MYKDFMGRTINVGDDVIYFKIGGFDEVKGRSGKIIELEDEYVLIRYFEGAGSIRGSRVLHGTQNMIKIDIFQEHMPEVFL